MTDLEQAAGRLSQAIQFRTVSGMDPEAVDAGPFEGFAAFLAEAYPLLHQKLQKTIVNRHGLVYRWAGKSREKPVLLTAHYDVVPAQDEGWPFPPFSGTISEGRVYGRGALDDKGSLIAILEAVTALLEQDYQPARDLWLAFGFDEEVGGREGAQQIARHFEQTGLRFDFVLDEGGAVADGSLMGIAPPIAVVGIAEKGNCSFELRFTGEEGHSSAPPAETAVSRMAAFISAVQRKPMKPRLTGTVKAMMRTLAPHKRGIQRLVMGHPGLFAPMIIRSMLKNRQTAAMLRSIVAFTMASGGSAHNVLPEKASCTANVRVLEGDRPEDIVAGFRAHGIPVDVRPIMVNAATRSSDTGAPGMQHLSRCIREVFPDALVMPYLMVGGTDCRYYEKVAANSYRFLPARLGEQELSLIHGRGESLSLENLERMIAFYKLFLSNLP